MTPLLQQFLAEAREFLQGISEKLMQLENTPDDGALMGELFRLVHTLKGNCGLFDYPEMLRVLHAAEDLMVVVRDGDLPYSQTLADRLLDAMDFVSLLLDEIDAGNDSAAAHAPAAVAMAAALRQLIAAPQGIDDTSGEAATATDGTAGLPLQQVPEALRMDWYRTGKALLWISYTPEAECFFKGEDPFFLARNVPDIAWQRVGAASAWPALDDLDAYHANLQLDLVSSASRAALDEHFRYVPEQITITPLTALALVQPQGDENGGPVYEDFVLAALAHLERGDLVTLERAARSMLELSAAGLWLASALRWLLVILETEPANRAALHAVIVSLRTFAPPRLSAQAVASVTEAVAAPAPAPSPAHDIAATVIATQLMILRMPDQVNWLPGRLKAVGSTLAACFASIGRTDLLPGLDAALAGAMAQSASGPLLAWLLAYAEAPAEVADTVPVEAPAADSAAVMLADSDIKFNRRAEDSTTVSAKTLRVDQDKIDRLMNLIGEMVVAKNGLPYLAGRAESVFGVRELSREIKTQYAVINRIAEEMQGAIMQVRMMPVSFVFQRFPRLVRDISRKLGKEVSLVLIGEDTEADKNIIEALADPLIHIVRNSLDHGLESPEVRRAAGKPAEGKLEIRATQEAGRVIIDIIDDGKGIDPLIIKRKAYEKGLIDEATLERISDQEAINLVFAAGFSTAEVVSDLSGRGVGMDVVRAAVEQVNGIVTLESTVGTGTRLRLSLPLSIAVTNVMIIESNRQIFGVPMDMVVETVRVPRTAIHAIKNHQTAVLRGRVVPLRSLNTLLATNEEQLANDEDELATLVVRLNGEHVGIVVDDFREVVDIILKPMGGILGGLSGYTGSALLGDGSVLMVLNLKELV
ncbi:Signal transduction histidine kinase CheA [Oxalobacteraceae bacterium IMCC9480]|nr:Signal transduction histidine kinase CheA [Oxalobacteraceae bacterium IMCC9480]NDP59822.1 chemotaxis protein CheA [Oxalobacteraceae bacterium]